MAAALRNGRIKPPAANIPPPEAAPKRTIRHGDPKSDEPKLRCAITGKPITAKEVRERRQVVRLIHEENKLPEDGDPAYFRRRYVPLAIDTSHPFPTDGGGAYRDYLGGLEWSVPLQKWFGSETTTLLADALRDYREWWRDFEILDALRMEFGNEKVDAVLEYIRVRALPFNPKKHQPTDADIDDALRHRRGWTREQYARLSEYVLDNFRPKLRDIGREGLYQFARERTVRWPDGVTPGARAEERAMRREQRREQEREARRAEAQTA